MTYNKDYWDGRGNSFYKTQHLVEAVIAVYYIGNNINRLLDFGCGFGYHLHTFIGMGIDAIGVDKSDYCIEHPFGLAKDRIFKQIPKLCYDVVYSHDVFEHLTDDEVHETLKKFCLVSDNLFIRIGFKHDENYKTDKTHINPKTKEEWVSILKEYYVTISDLPVYLSRNNIFCTRPKKIEFI